MESVWPAAARDENAPRAMRDWARKLEAKPKSVVSASGARARGRAADCGPSEAALQSKGMASVFRTDISQRARMLLPAAGAVFLMSCGFSPQPASGRVVCKPQGSACCPDGYLCVGRGLPTADGPAAGACWSKDDLPPEAGLLARDHTPTVGNDSACLVTDWLPPELTGIGMALDAGVPDSWGGNVGITTDPIASSSKPDAALPVRDASSAKGDRGGDGPPDIKAVVTTVLVAGDQRTFAVAGGALWGWGGDQNGALGDGTAELRVYQPVQILGAEYNVTAVATGSTHTCAVANGGVRCWGSNTAGALGDGTTTDHPTPVQVVGLETGATAVAVGGLQSCAVVNGGVQCWGEIISQKGSDWQPRTITSPVPVPIIGVESGVTGITAGSYHACAIVNGGVRCWGSDLSGVLGDGPTYSNNKLVDVVGLGPGAGVTAISAKERSTCAVVNGGVRCWGVVGSFAPAPDGFTIVESDVPIPVPGLTENVTDISVGSEASVGSNVVCVVMSGAARCLGANPFCGLGWGWEHKEDDFSAVPVQVVGLTSGVASVAVGYRHACARLGSGVKCWGGGLEGELGNADDYQPDQCIPVDVLFP